MNANLANLANMQNANVAALNGLNGQLAALQQQAVAAGAAANGQRPPMPPGNPSAALAAGIGALNAGGAGSVSEQLLQNLQKIQLAKAMQEGAAAAAAAAASMPGGLSNGGAPAAGEKGLPGAQPAAGGDVAANNSKEQRRLALACVALQLARGGMTVEQAINSGIMGGMSVTDVKFIVECYNAERDRMKGEAGGGAPGGGGPGSTGTTESGGATPQTPGLPGLSGLPLHMQPGGLEHLQVRTDGRADDRCVPCGLSLSRARSSRRRSARPPPAQRSLRSPGHASLIKKLHCWAGCSRRSLAPTLLARTWLSPHWKNPPHPPWLGRGHLSATGPGARFAL